MVLLENHKFMQNFDYLPKLRHLFHFFGTINGNYIIFQIVTYIYIYIYITKLHVDTWKPQIYA